MSRQTNYEFNTFEGMVKAKICQWPDLQRADGLTTALSPILKKYKFNGSLMCF
jgi:hypothetical protein